MKEILVVDDDSDTLEIVSELLLDAGYQVRTARCGLEALTRIRRSLPDLLLVDLFMPVMDGWQLLDELKSEPSLKRLPPTVMMTAWPRPVDLPQGVSLLRKPFEWDTLVRLVRKHCGEAMVKCVPSRDVDPLRLNVAALGQ